MLTDEERRDIDILRTATMPLLTPERTTLIAIALRTADSCERLDAELKAAEAYGQLEHDKLHQEHRARMKAEAEVERLQLAVIREREQIWAEREQHEAALREVQK